ncbi:unnamed protein product, partial [marine sediment metagenome]
LQGGTSGDDIFSALAGGETGGGGGIGVGVSTPGGTGTGEPKAWEWIVSAVSWGNLIDNIIRSTKSSKKETQRRERVEGANYLNQLAARGPGFVQNENRGPAEGLDAWQFSNRVADYLNEVAGIPIAWQTIMEGLGESQGRPLSPAERERALQIQHDPNVLLRAVQAGAWPGNEPPGTLPRPAFEPRQALPGTTGPPKQQTPGNRIPIQPEWWDFFQGTQSLAQIAS